MTKRIIVLGVSSLVAISAFAAQVETSKLKQLADIKITAYNHQLRTTLQSTIDLGTLKRSVKGCESIAQNMLIQNGTGGWDLERTSLNFRNPDNKPDSWEANQLKQFQKAFENGKPISQMSVERLTSVGPKKVVYKYMKAIEAEPVCLNCHGSNMLDTVNENLAIHYPNDKAVGYKAGDLMGAFVLKKIVRSK